MRPLESCVGDVVGAQTVTPSPLAGEYLEEAIRGTGWRGSDLCNSFRFESGSGDVIRMRFRI